MCILSVKYKANVGKKISEIYEYYNNKYLLINIEYERKTPKIEEDVNRGERMEVKLSFNVYTILWTKWFKNII